MVNGDAMDGWMDGWMDARFCAAAKLNHELSFLGARRFPWNGFAATSRNQCLTYSSVYLNARSLVEGTAEKDHD